MNVSQIEFQEHICCLFLRLSWMEQEIMSGVSRNVETYFVDYNNISDNETSEFLFNRSICAVVGNTILNGAEK